MKRRLRILEKILWICALLLISLAGWWRLEAYVSQRSAARIGQDAAKPAMSAASFGSSDAVTGRLECAAIGLTVAIVGNYDSDSLTRGVGYVPGTAFPGGLGNMVLAGHRDTFFRPLRHVQPGMKLEVITTRGRFEYQVDRAEVVEPKQVDVLDIGEIPELTLITCFPFEYIGPAPQRFVVHAHLISSLK